MLNISQIPSYIMEDLKQRGHSEETIATMTPKEAFSEYCMWNGLIHWGASLWNAVMSLNAAETIASPSANAEAELLVHCKKLKDQGRRVDAVKLYRNTTGSSLREAHDKISCL